MAGYVIDSWAWMEYIDGSQRGKKVDEFLESKEPILCATISIAEVISKLKRRGLNSEIGRKAIIANAKIIELDAGQAQDAGQIHADMRKTVPDFGMADAIVLATARKLNAKVVTGDPHFSNIEESIMV